MKLKKTVAKRTATPLQKKSAQRSLTPQSNHIGVALSDSGSAILKKKLAQDRTPEPYVIPLVGTHQSEEAWPMKSVGSEHPLQLVYLVEWEDGFCRVQFFPEHKIRQMGGLAALEATLASRYKWYERLGYIPDFFDDVPTAHLDRLLLYSTRRVVCIDDEDDVDEVRYKTMGWGPKN